MSDEKSASDLWKEAEKAWRTAAIFGFVSAGIAFVLILLLIVYHFFR